MVARIRQDQALQAMLFFSCFPRGSLLEPVALCAVHCYVWLSKCVAWASNRTIMLIHHHTRNSVCQKSLCLTITISISRALFQSRQYHCCIMWTRLIPCPKMSATEMCWQQIPHKTGLLGGSTIDQHQL